MMHGLRIFKPQRNRLVPVPPVSRPARPLRRGSARGASQPNRDFGGDVRNSQKEEGAV
jgi:hypothetical protein